MAVLKQVLHKKTSSGYDTVYLRTRADNVLMTDNSTLLSNKIAAMDTTIAGKAASSHNHAASNITSGVLAAARGGTGNTGTITNAGTYAIMRKAGDGDYMWYTNTGNGAFYATGANTLAKFGILPVAQGGTGVTTLAALKTALSSTASNYTELYNGTVTTIPLSNTATTIATLSSSPRNFKFIEVIITNGYLSTTTTRRSSTFPFKLYFGSSVCYSGNLSSNSTYDGTSITGAKIYAFFINLSAVTNAFYFGYNYYWESYGLDSDDNGDEVISSGYTSNDKTGLVTVANSTALKASIGTSSTSSYKSYYGTFDLIVRGYNI